jgi:hypothetical protein
MGSLGIPVVNPQIRRPSTANPNEPNNVYLAHFVIYGYQPVLVQLKSLGNRSAGAARFSPDFYFHHTAFQQYASTSLPAHFH